MILCICAQIISHKRKYVKVSQALLVLSFDSAHLFCLSRWLPLPGCQDQRGKGSFRSKWKITRTGCLQPSNAQAFHIYEWSVIPLLTMVWAAVVIPAKNQELSVSRLYTVLYVTSTQSFGKFKTVGMSKQLCVRIARK